MNRNADPAANILLLRGAVLWLLAALILAWCMVFLSFDVVLFKIIFQGKFSRLLQAHLDFLMMSALLFGFYAAKAALPCHVCWAMVIGAFTNPSLFLLQAVFPVLDGEIPSQDLLPSVFRLYLMASIVVTSYGFGRGAVLVLRSTFKTTGLMESPDKPTAGD